MPPWPHAKLLVEPHDQIAGPPADDPIDRQDRAVLYKASEECLVFACQLARRARRRLVDETVRPLLVERVHPVPQCPPIHAADSFRR